ncbi:hypothetical protein SK128_020209 [Halocaridina rubra]|uniref:MAP3K HisK-N-like globin domain-containing protein n=1 Tax=Halocaridina rubra TaxID=373956 RepID=A0AAN8ZXS2_HALRR
MEQQQFNTGNQFIFQTYPLVINIQDGKQGAKNSTPKVSSIEINIFPHQEHLLIIMVGLREFIPEQKKQPIEQAFGSLKAQLDFEDASNQINLALYTFQDAINLFRCPVEVLTPLLVDSPLDAPLGTLIILSV